MSCKNKGAFKVRSNTDLQHAIIEHVVTGEEGRVLTYLTLGVVSLPKGGLFHLCLP